MLKKDKMSEIVIHQSSDDQTQIEVKFEGDTVWLMQKHMSGLFQTTPQNITLHLKKIYAEDEIEEKPTCKEYLQVQKEGKRQVKRKQLVYNSDAILSVGYRINTKRGTQFRQWGNRN
ncbi:MAG: RhuM family protein [Agriterribacter sp.]